VPATHRALLTSVFGSIAVALAAVSASAQPRATTIVASDPVNIRRWDADIDALLRAGDLAVRRTDIDTLVAGRTHTRLQQLHRGVPIIGAELTRQTDDIGATVSIYGTMYSGVNIDVTPVLSPDAAAAIVARRSGVELGPSRMPALWVFPADDRFRLVYRATAFSINGGTAYIIDAGDGSILQETDAVERQSAVGTGTGVLGPHTRWTF